MNPVITSTYIVSLSTGLLRTNFSGIFLARNFPFPPSEKSSPQTDILVFLESKKKEYWGHTLSWKWWICLNIRCKQQPAAGAKQICTHVRLFCSPPPCESRFPAIRDGGDSIMVATIVCFISCSGEYCIDTNADSLYITSIVENTPTYFRFVEIL